MSAPGRPHATDHPILVVGGRTTGLTLACELARHGVAVRIVDASPGIDPHVRASFLHSRTLEVFQDLGIVDDVLARGEPMRGLSEYANGRRFLHMRYEGVDSPYPWGLAIGQHETEAALERLLNRLGVAVERRTELVELEVGRDAVRAILRHADGRREVVDTPWLAGCDGAHSTVRHAIHEPFPGDADPRQYVLADVRVDCELAADEVHGFLGDHGALFFFMLPGGRRLLCSDVAAQHDAAAEQPALADIQALVDQRGPAGARVYDPRWLAYFRIHYRLAPAYRHGRVLLAGDAVHVHSLVGGQGMNTGIQDAYNLAWKLALVARGRAPATLLDTYDTERRCVARDVLATTRAVTERAESFAHLADAERERLYFHMVVPEPQRLAEKSHVEELDLDYRSSPICAERIAGDAAAPRLDEGPHAGAEARDAGPLEVAGERTTLFALLRGPRHVLLSFAGAAETDGTGELARLAASAARAHADAVALFVVVAGDAEVPPLPPGVTLVRDRQATAHRRYGAEAPCLYLIRPDGYVGYRCAPPDARALEGYLCRLLPPPPGA